jgi:tetratricopeptide (TPR) repeat protein
MARKHGEHQAALAYVDRALEITATGRQDRMQLQFAAGALCDAVEEYENAFLHFEKANQLAVTSYSADQHERSIDRTIQYLSSDTFRRLPRSNYVSEKKPVFVVGMPRSGTSLVEQILASHRQVFAAGELPNIHRLSRALSEKAGNHEAASPDYLSRLAQKQISEEARVYISSLESRAPQACRFVDKTPHNYLYLPLIRLMFPEARIIHCVRHPLDTCLSCYFRLFNGGNDYSYDLNNLGRHYRDYSRLMQHWQQVLRIPMLEIRYEDLVLDQETYSKAIIEYCGLQWEEQCMSFYETRRDVPSASFDQVNKPIYRGSMQRWRHYRGQLTDLRRCLGGIVSAYETTAPS